MKFLQLAQASSRKKWATTFTDYLKNRTHALNVICALIIIEIYITDRYYIKLSIRSEWSLPLFASNNNVKRPYWFSWIQSNLCQTKNNPKNTNVNDTVIKKKQL